MYIKKIKKRNGVTDKVYTYLHLVESIRTPDGPRPKLILNLGNLDLDPSQYQAFAQAVDNRLSGQMSIIELDKNLEKPVRDTVKKIFKKQAQEIQAGAEEEYQMMDVNSLESDSHRSIGGEYICHSICKELGLDKFFAKYGISESVISIIEALIIGRLIDPGSERYTKKWAEARSSIYELTTLPYQASLNSYYRATDKIFKLKEKLESYLKKTEKEIFNLSEKMVFYDLTNTYLHRKALQNKKAKYGKSKQKRSDCKLITLGLIIDDQGFAKHSKLFSGNVVEGKTLADMVATLEKGYSPKDRTIVVDAGLATKENIKWLKDNKYNYIVVNRGKAPFEKEFHNMRVIKEDEQKGIKVEVKRFEKDDIYILCRSKQREATERGIRSRQEEQFVDQLKYYNAGLKLSKRTKQYHKVLELVGRLREKYPKASKLYAIEIEPEKNKAANNRLKAVDIKWEKKAINYEKEIKQEGSYVLRTDRVDLSDKEIWELYVMLTNLEDVFRTMKSHLGLRPVFHRLEKRTDAHLFISVIAYHIAHIILHRLRQRGDTRNWQTIRNILKTYQRFTLSYNAKDANGQKRKYFIRMNSKCEPEHLEIYRALNLSGNPLPKKKMSTL